MNVTEKEVEYVKRSKRKSGNTYHREKDITSVLISSIEILSNVILVYKLDEKFKRSKKNRGIEVGLKASTDLIKTKRISFHTSIGEIRKKIVK